MRRTHSDQMTHFDPTSFRMNDFWFGGPKYSNLNAAVKFFGTVYIGGRTFHSFVYNSVLAAYLFLRVKKNNKHFVGFSCQLVLIKQNLKNYFCSIYCQNNDNFYEILAYLD